MRKIIEFIDLLFGNEQQALSLETEKSKIEEYNNFVENEINIYCEPYFDKVLNHKTSFDIMGKIFSPYSDRYYDRVKNAPAPNLRQLYKTSEYTNEKYGQIWACYCSIANPYDNVTGLDDCFIVTTIDNELKIVMKSITDPDTKKWLHVGGDEDLNVYELGKLVAIERILEPRDNAWSMEEYNKER
ncbi:MAG: hypothetical protein HRT69_11765 [Flavobacteriaceae bacterium]|nr:hypothetical protein [Flavobacteriaceae bacterium]